MQLKGFTDFNFVRRSGNRPTYGQLDVLAEHPSQWFLPAQSSWSERGLGAVPSGNLSHHCAYFTLSASSVFQLRGALNKQWDYIWRRLRKWS